MANTTDTYWSVDGQSLQTYARNISSLEGKLSMPGLRGSDDIIPHRRGTRWTKKTVDGRTLPLAMWVSDSDADGVKGTTKSARAANFDANWRALMNLLWREGDQFTLTKRFNYSGGIRIAHAKAEFGGAIAPAMVGRYAARAVINLYLSDPYFYDDVQETHNLSNGDQNIMILGDVPTYNIEVNIAGARNQPILWNKTLGQTLQYNGQLQTGDTTTINVPNFRSWTVDAANPLGYTSNARLLKTGGVMLFGLKNGVNAINLASTTGSGLVSLKSRAAWL